MTSATPQEAKEPRPAAVYRLYDTDGTLLYIGSAYDPEERCKEHRGQPWWPRVARRTEEWFGHRNSAYAAEMKAIAAEKPLHNAMGPGYAQRVTDATRQRNELASLRQKLLREAGQIGLQVSDALRKQGVSYPEARRAGEEATIGFLEETGLFAGAVKRRRALLADAVDPPEAQDIAKTRGMAECLRRAALVFQAIERAQELGWADIAVVRLTELASGDESALPPAPVELSGSASRQPDCNLAEADPAR